MRGMGKRNELLNIVEAIAALLVVCIHFPFGGRGRAVIALATVSVPFFFSISGYFLYKGNTQTEFSNIPRKIKRLIGLMLASELVYFLFYTALNMRHTGISLEAVKRTIEEEVINYYFKNLAERLVVFAPPLNVIAWFIGSLIIVYAVIMLILRRKWFLKVLYGLAVSLPLTMLLRRIFLIADLKALLPDERILPLLPLPFFALGYLIHKHKAWVCRYSNCGLLLVLVAGAALTLLENCLWQHTLYFGTAVIVPTLLILCIKNDGYKPRSLCGCIMSHIGANTATYIYIFHILIETIVRVLVYRVFPNIEQSAIWQIIYPVLIFAASAVCGELIYRTKRLCRRIRSSK